VITLVGLVVGVAAVAIGVYYVAGMARAAPEIRMIFTAVWMLASLLVVLTGLTRIRRARLAAAGKG